MRSFDEYHNVSFKGMGEKEELGEHEMSPMGLVIDMEKLKELIRERCPECGKTSFVIDRIEFTRHWNSVEIFHRGVNSDHILLGSVYTVICGEEGCDFEYEKSIPVEFYNGKPGITSC